MPNVRAPSNIDFREFGQPVSDPNHRILVRDIVDRPTVYRLTGWSERELLYVGVTGNIGARLVNHARQQPWWHEVAAVSCEYFDTTTAATLAEARAIKAEQPRYNLRLR